MQTLQEKELKLWSLPKKVDWSIWGPVLLLATLMLFALRYLLNPSLFAANSQETQSVSSPGNSLQFAPEQVAGILLRDGFGPEDSTLEILYAPTWYFEWSNREAPKTVEPVLVFFIVQTIHDGELGEELPIPELTVAGASYEAVAVTMVNQAPHHRTFQAIFNASDSAGQAVVDETSSALILNVPIDSVGETSSQFVWDLPISNGLGVVNDPETESASISSLSIAPVLTAPALLAIMGGMFAALSPCLLQLTAYYATTIVGVGAGTQDLIKANKKIQRVGLFFVVGFTLVYTAGGAAAGYVGDSIQELAALNSWSRPLSIVAGVVVLYLAFRVAVQARAPLVCKLPIEVKPDAGTGKLNSAFMGFTFAVGCLSCFSATVLSALLLYAGSTGSPLVGAMLLFLFSGGVGLIFLLATVFAGKALPFMNSLQKAQPIIGGVSALLMAAWGVLMITYKFHVLSGFLYRLFS